MTLLAPFEPGRVLIIRDYSVPKKVFVNSFLESQKMLSLFDRVTWAVLNDRLERLRG